MPFDRCASRSLKAPKSKTKSGSAPVEDIRPGRDPPIWLSTKHGGHMARYTVHVPQSDMAMGLQSPLSAIEAYYKVRELREMGFKTVFLRNAETGEEID